MNQDRFQFSADKKLNDICMHRLISVFGDNWRLTSEITVMSGNSFATTKVPDSKWSVNIELGDNNGLRIETMFDEELCNPHPGVPAVSAYRSDGTIHYEDYWTPETIGANGDNSDGYPSRIIYDSEGNIDRGQFRGGRQVSAQEVSDILENARLARVEALLQPANDIVALSQSSRSPCLQLEHIHRNKIEI